jgi:hypothetical protein
MLNCLLVYEEKLYSLLLTTCHIHDRIFSIKLKVSPYELWKKRKINFNYLKVWGCLTFYRVPNSKMIKLGPKTLKWNFVGYAENSKAYGILYSSSNVIMESRDTEFIKNKFQTDSNSISELINNSEIEIELTNNASFDPNYRNK